MSLDDMDTDELVERAKDLVVNRLVRSNSDYREHLRASQVVEAIEALIDAKLAKYTELLEQRMVQWLADDDPPSTQPETQEAGK